MNEATLRIDGTARLDDGREFHLLEWKQTAPERIPVEGWKADTAWSFTDKNGHVHAWYRRAGTSESPTLPTLVGIARHVDCDESCGNWDCDGYDVTDYSCAQCGEPVEPGRKHGTDYISGGASESRVTLVSAGQRERGIVNAPVTLIWGDGTGITSTIRGTLTESGVNEVSHDPIDGVREKFECMFIPDTPGGIE